MIQIHDIVGRKSYDCDVFFRVKDVKDNVAILYGEDFRLVADAPINDLLIIDDLQLKKQSENNVQEINVSNFLLAQEQEKIKQKKEYELTEGFREENDFFHMPGRVLHLDGDRNYLQKCLLLYKKMNVPVIGIHCHEKEMPYQVVKLIDKYRPDILVITGHDAYSKLKGDIHDMSAYRHSKEFVQTVYEARKKEPNLDQLVIFAGACQSHFESLIQAGANFASSPSRVNIHALDPVYIVGKISFTPFMERVHVWEALKSTLTGEKGLGGIETKGVLRIGMPYRNQLKQE